MTVQFYNPYGQYGGILSFDLDSLSDDQGNCVCNVVSSILAELATFEGSDFTGTNLWWKGVLSVDIAPDNAIKYKSALPKYDLGCFTFVGNGIAQQDGFWNYVSQGLSNAMLFAIPSLGTYPQIPPVPSVSSPVGAVFGWNYYFFGGADALFADTLYINSSYKGLGGKLTIFYYTPNNYYYSGDGFFNV